MPQILLKRRFLPRPASRQEPGRSVFSEKRFPRGFALTAGGNAYIISDKLPAWSDGRIAQAVGVTIRAMENVCRRWIEHGFERALVRKKRETPPVELRLTGDRELVLACSPAPEGRVRWTLSLLTEKQVELRVFDAISTASVATALKKTGVQPHRKKCWRIPEEQSAEFVARMEDVLDVYQRPYDPQCPVVCMNESNKQFSIEVRPPIPAGPGRVRREDGEWKPNGVADIFMFVEPLTGKQVVSVTEKREAIDWAHRIKEILTVHYAETPRICLVMDNLNTHDVSSLYKAFPTTEAKALAKRLEIHHTPKHGGWLNMAVCELSVLCSQCLNRRIPDIDAMRQEVMNWTSDRNNRAEKTEWQFTAKDARIKLKSLYPKI